MSDELKTPDEWQEVTGVRVLDPDGWRRDGKSWTEAIPEEEFRQRATWSTLYQSAWPMRAAES